MDAKRAYPWVNCLSFSSRRHLRVCAIWVAHNDEASTMGHANGSQPASLPSAISGGDSIRSGCPRTLFDFFENLEKLFRVEEEVWIGVLQLRHGRS